MEVSELAEASPDSEAFILEGSATDLSKMDVSELSEASLDLETFILEDLPQISPKCRFPSSQKLLRPWKLSFWRDL